MSPSPQPGPTREQGPPPRPYREAKEKASKRERAENEFIDALEQVIGGHFTALQKDQIKMIRQDLLSGRPFAFNSMRRD